jgi:outer membrane receptor protein involved in Fe transport
MRYLFHSTHFDVNSGFGYRDKNEDRKQLTGPFTSKGDFDTKFTNVYAYSQVYFPKNIDLTIGASADFLDGASDDEDRNQFNPKMGLTWSPLPSTTVRAAVFRTLQKPGISRENIDPTLEPTQVAGFNQFFFGAEGNREWRYGIAVDQKFSQNINGGAEFSARDIDAQLLRASAGSPEVIRRDWDEYQARAYFYWTPYSRLALSAEYLYEHFKREENGGFVGPEEFKKLRTHRVPLSARFFHPFGFSAGLKATYVNQDGDFLVPQPFGFSIESGDDQFWVFDALIGYRLPKRYGQITLEAKNLFDEEFKFQDTDPGNPRILPERLILLKATLSF